MHPLPPSDLPARLPCASLPHPPAPQGIAGPVAPAPGLATEGVAAPIAAGAGTAEEGARAGHTETRVGTAEVPVVQQVRRLEVWPA